MNNIGCATINYFLFVYFQKFQFKLYNFDKKIIKISIIKQTTRDLNIDGS